MSFVLSDGILQSVDGLASKCTDSNEDCKAFNQACGHFFNHKGLFYARYYNQIIDSVDYIEADMATTGIQVHHADFRQRYGLGSSRFNDYRKLRRSQTLQDLARTGKLTSTYLREFNAAAPMPVPPLSAELVSVLDGLRASAEASDSRAVALNGRGQRLGMQGLVEIPANSVNAAIKRQLKETMAGEGLGNITLTACKYNKKKAEIFDLMAQTFKNSPMIIAYHGTTAEAAQKICREGPDMCYAKGSGDDGGIQRVFYVTTSPPVADAWHRTEINLLTKIARVTTSDEAGEEETKAGQEHGRGTMRTMVAFKVLLVGGSAGIRPSGCTGNTWKFPSNALPLMKPIYQIDYEWKKPNVLSNKLRPTFPPGFTTKNALEAAPDQLLIKHMLKGAVFARGVATPEFLAYVFGMMN